MSTNLLYNPNFDLPLITTNDYKYYPNLTEEEQTSFYWTVGTNNYISLQNGTSIFNFASPSLLNLNQAISFQYDSDISQTVTIFDLVTYQLKFNYVCRPAYTIIPLNVYFNDVLTYTVTTYTTSWSEVVIDYLPSEFGNLTIKFATISDGYDKSMCFTNIKFYIKPTTGGGGAPVGTSKLVTYNSLKNTNIYGYLNVNDYVNGGSVTEGIIRCPKLILNKTDINNTLYTGNVRASSNIFLNNINISTTFTTGTLNTTTLNLNGVNIGQSLTTNTLNTTTLNLNGVNIGQSLTTDAINFNYPFTSSILPTLSFTNLGYKYTLNYTGSTSIAANAYAVLTINLPAGIFIVDAFGFFSVSIGSVSVRLGMNTVNNSYTAAYNNTTLFVSNTTGQSIKYNYILTNSTQTIYYILYNCATASTLTRYQVNILRIA